MLQFGSVIWCFISATVLYDYDPEVADELKLRVGDVLTNIQKIEDGWCQGVLNGKTGMFPDNFVKVFTDFKKGICWFQKIFVHLFNVLQNSSKTVIE